MSLRCSENHPSLCLSNQVQGPEFYPEMQQRQFLHLSSHGPGDWLALFFCTWTSHFRHQRFLSDTVFPPPLPFTNVLPISTWHVLLIPQWPITYLSSCKKRLLTPDSQGPLFLTKNTRSQSRGCSSVQPGVPFQVTRQEYQVLAVFCCGGIWNSLSSAAMFCFILKINIFFQQSRNFLICLLMSLFFLVSMVIELVKEQLEKSFYSRRI